MRSNSGRKEVVKPEISEPADRDANDVPLPHAFPVVDAVRPPPTMLAYTLAMNSSDGALDDLLDHHANTLLPRTSEENMPWSDTARRRELQEK